MPTRLQEKELSMECNIAQPGGMSPKEEINTCCALTMKKGPIKNATEKQVTKIFDRN
jgi:hypothetical protein